jgi:heme/copper-type cytochrome/quinol oxidase subunit 2
MLHQKLLIPHVAIPEVSFFNPARLLLTDNVFPVPCKTWLRFLISSKDVIHSWAVPAFGIKCDAVPGRLNEVTAFMDYQGVYFGQCSELCGINHGFMPIHIWAYDAEISLSEYADPSQINRPHYAKPTKVASLNKKPAGW